MTNLIHINKDEKVKIKIDGSIMRNLVKIGLSICMLVVLSGCDNKEQKINSFIDKIYSIDSDVRKSALYSSDLEPKIDDLPKTITIDEKEYGLIYLKYSITVLNFNNPFYCDKTFMATTTDSNKTFVLGSKEVRTECKNNNMSIMYNAVGM